MKSDLQGVLLLLISVTYIHKLTCNRALWPVV